MATNINTTKVSLEEAHLNVILFVFGKRLILIPALHFQVRNDVLPGCCRCLFSPTPAGLLNSRSMVSEFAMAHPVWRTPGELI